MLRRAIRRSFGLEFEFIAQPLQIACPYASVRNFMNGCSLSYCNLGIILRVIKICLVVMASYVTAIFICKEFSLLVISKIQGVNVSHFGKSNFFLSCRCLLRVCHYGVCGSHQNANCAKCAKSALEISLKPDHGKQTKM